MILQKHLLRQAHRFLERQAFYPMLLSTALAMSLFSGRVYRSHTLVFLFLVWNLFLAWIPYLSAIWASALYRRHPRKWWFLGFPGLLWLAFFPNAPYLVTDLLHLQERASIPIWYDIGMLAVFAWTGLFLGVFSLRLLQRLVRDYLGALLSWLFVLLALALGGLGIYLGRFLRWNSWDLVLSPRGVLKDVVIRVINPLSNLQTFGVTFLFASILLVCYLTITGREPSG